MSRQESRENQAGNLNRREFVRVVGATAACAGAASLLPTEAFAAPKPTSQAETIVKEFHASLSAEQQKVLCLPFDHAKRSEVNANWHITKPELGDDFYTKAQRDLAQRVVKAVTSEDGYQRLLKQMDDDAGGLDGYSIALFGSPEDKLQWTLTGRHLTLRADGDSVPGMAFGGPLVYGHGEEDPKQNFFHYQTKKVNEVFAALDEKHRKQALLKNAPRENQVPIQGADGSFPGLAASELSSDQKELFESAIKTILAPYREEDVDEVIAILKQSGGLDKLHLAFYQQGDLGSDQVWDIWRVEGPSFVWHFRGAPHVHAYIHIGQKA